MLLWIRYQLILSSPLTLCLCKSKKDINEMDNYLQLRGADCLSAWAGKPAPAA